MEYQFRERYNEIMFDERDLIKEFLERQANLCYGNQMFEWCLPEIPMRTRDDNVVCIREIALEKNKIVEFRSTTNQRFAAEDFHYSELQHIIEELPPVEDVVARVVDTYLRKYTRECGISLEENPFVWYDGNTTFEIHTICRDKDRDIVDYEIKESFDGCEGWGLWEDLPTEIMQDFLKHVRRELLRRSDAYKEFVSTFGEGHYNFNENCNFGELYITPEGTDLELDVLDVEFENGELNVLVSIEGTRLTSYLDDDTLNLSEGELSEGNIKSLLEFFGKKVMDNTNHNEELVKDINRAWNMPKYKDSFGIILLAILKRDIEEHYDKLDDVALTCDYAMKNASYILQNICDDRDLHTILSFIKYI